MLKKGDVILTALVLLAVVAGFGVLKLRDLSERGTYTTAVIKQNDKVIRRIDLSKVKEPQRIEVVGDYTDVVLVEKGRIRFEEADCPDQVCVRTGWISKKGDVAVCLPNRAMIKIEGEPEEIDGSTY